MISDGTFSWKNLLEPVLRELSDGQVAKLSGLRDRISRNIHLTQDDLSEKTAGGHQKFGKNVSWALSRLKEYKLVDNKKRGFWRIEQPGRDLLSQHEGKIKSTLNKISLNRATSPQDVDSDTSAPQHGHYTTEDIIKDGCFLDPGEIDKFLKLLESKKNLILQGPPGVGKTWIAKRLAYALMGERNEQNVRAVQFHPNLSYEDFIRGWRPTGKGKLELSNGIFLELIDAAREDEDSKFIIVVEEINRGNPAQIFGEVLTLLEADKREESEAIELCYPDENGNRKVYIPKNLYVIGTMNIADRSLALVDLALRRRFAFATLEPRFEDAWIKWIVRERGVDRGVAEKIRKLMNKLNDDISSDLGDQFRIGHSFVTPPDRIHQSTRDWFFDAVRYEIGPLLDEYWFDNPEKAKGAKERLREL